MGWGLLPSQYDLRGSRSNWDKALHRDALFHSMRQFCGVTISIMANFNSQHDLSESRAGEKWVPLAHESLSLSGQCKSHSFLGLLASSPSLTFDTHKRTLKISTDLQDKASLT